MLGSSDRNTRHSAMATILIALFLIPVASALSPWMQTAFPFSLPWEQSPSRHSSPSSSAQWLQRPAPGPGFVPVWP